MPDPSERTTGVMAREGRALPPLSAAIFGSDQFLILPVKIWAIVSGDNCRLVMRFPVASSRLYMSAVPPATIGKY